MNMEDKSVEEELTYPIFLGEQVRRAVDEACSFKYECNNLRCLVDTLVDMLRLLIRFISSVQSFYDRPVRRIIAEVCNSLDKALTLARKCKRRSFFHRVVNIVTAADFRKVQIVLEASVGDLKWLKSVIESNEGGVGMTLPPIASNDPILAWVWSSITSLYMSDLSDKIEAANELASLANDNDRNKQIIVEEGGISPLLKLLKENGSVEAQIAGANALCCLANDCDRVRAIVNDLGVPVIVKTLADSPMNVQSLLASLIARMAKHDPLAQDDFARENVIRPLVTLLAFETFSDDQTTAQLVGKQHIHSIARINKEIENNMLNASGKNNGNNFRPYVNSFSSFRSEGSSRGGNRKERENERPETKHRLKICCAEAMWMLARGSVPNSKRITETKGLLCLAKLVEKEEGELKYNCLMTIQEITAAAESNADLRRAAFKTNSPAAKAVVDQLLRLIESDSPILQIPAIRSIGSLARTFPARETRVIPPLVALLSSRNIDVAMEATIALVKFASPENFLCDTHCKTITDHKAVAALMRLLRGNDKRAGQALILLCYLALHAGNNENLDQTRLLTVLQGADKAMMVNHPELTELVPKAIYHISLYHPALHSQRFSSTYLI